MQNGRGAGCKLSQGKQLGVRGYLENRWMKEGVDFVRERKHGAGHAQNQQEQAGTQPTGKMEFEQDRTYPSATIHPLDTPD